MSNQRFYDQVRVTIDLREEAVGIAAPAPAFVDVGSGPTPLDGGQALLWQGVSLPNPVNDALTGTQGAPRVIVLDANRYLVVWTSDAVPGGVSDPELRGRLFDASNSPLAAEFAINTTTAGVQAGATAARLSGGGFVIAWQDDNVAADGSGSAIRFQRFDDNGAKVGAESVANVTTSGNQTRPSVAGLADGGFVVTWSDASQSGGDTSGLAIRGMRFSSTGTAIGSEFLVNTETNRSQTASQVVALATGGFAVVWQDGSPQGVTVAGQSREDHGTNIAVRAYDVAGVPLSAQRTVDTQDFIQFVLNSDSGFVTARDPSATVLTDGRIAVVWTDGAFNGATLARILNADGTPAGGVITVDTNRTFGGLEPENLGSTPITISTAITALPNGGFVVGWAEQRQVEPEALTSAVWGRAFDSAGAAQGITFRLNDVAAGDQVAPALAAFANGNFIAAWQDGGTTDIGAQAFTITPGAVTDIALSGPIDRLGIGNLAVASLIGTGAVNAQFTYTLLADPSGAFAISGDRLVVADPEKLWSFAGTSVALQLRATDQQGNFYTETLNAPIAAVPYGRTMVAGAQFVAAPSTGIGFGPSPNDLLALPGNRQLLVTQEMVVATNSNEVVARFIEANGSVGTSFIVNTVTTGNQLGGRATMIGTDRILVAWNTPTSTNDVLGQVFDLAGNRIGGTFLLNTTTAGSQSTPSLVGMANGFFASWTDSNTASDGSSSAIRGQFFDANGTKIGAELVVNTTTAGAQNQTSAAVTTPGRIVVTWRDASATGGDTSGTAIRAQILNPDGTRFGSEFLVNTTTAGTQTQPAIVGLAGGGFVVAWISGGNTDGDVYAQIYNEQGVRVGAEFIVNSQRIGSQGTQGEPSIASDANGGFVVAWSDLTSFAGTDGDTTSIKAQRFAGDGTRIGGEFLVNSAGFSQQSNAIVEILSDGDLSFAWWDFSAAFSTVAESRTVMRLFDATSANRVPGGTTGADTLAGTVGDDVIDASQGGSDTVAGGGGNDGFYFGGAFDPTDSVDGGTGTLDQIGLQGDYGSMTLGANATVGVEAIVLLGGDDNRFGNFGGALLSYNLTLTDANIAAGDTLAFQANGLRAGENFALDASAETDGKILTFGGFGTEIITGGQADDGFYFGAGRFGAGERVSGGGGFDAIGFQGDCTGANALIFGVNQIVGIEVINLLSGTDARYGNGGVGFSYALTMNDGNVAAGGSLGIQANGLQSSEALIFDGSAELDGIFQVFGGAGNDSATVGQGADRVSAGGGNDMITGRGGADQLTGGAGNDSFVYMAVTDSTVSAQDHILDFASGDHIVVSAIDAVPGGAADSFTFIGSNAFTNGTAGQLRAALIGGNDWIVEGDVNGDGVADLSILVTTDHALTLADFTGAVAQGAIVPVGDGEVSVAKALVQDSLSGGDAKAGGDSPFGLDIHDLMSLPATVQIEDWRDAGAMYTSAHAASLDPLMSHDFA